MEPSLNLYGDQRTPTPSGHGVDIASQRVDELDEAALSQIRALYAATNRTPIVFDLGCGFGAHSARMAEAGAMVWAFDLDGNREEVMARAAAVGMASRVSFSQMDIRKGLAPIHMKVDVIYSQRTLHYLRFNEAVGVLKTLQKKGNGEKWVFLSVSGLASELGQGYEHAQVACEDRYAPLAPSMVEKHAIHGPVCLYSIEDMNQLLSCAGFTPVRVYASPFGNIKAIAKR